MLNGTRIGAVVPAAGKGKRMGGDIAKQFLELNGKPVLLHTLERLCSMPEVDIILIAAGDHDVNAVKKMISAHGLPKIKDVVPGGEQRQDSVWNCLQHLSESEAGIVLVHDAVRPFITRDLAIAVCTAAIQWDAAIPVVHPKDTIKTLDGGGFVSSTLDRDSLAVVQTPQAFRFSLIYRAYLKAMNEKFYRTDDASLVEWCGVRVKVVDGDYSNFKITTAVDLIVAQQLLSDV